MSRIVMKFGGTSVGSVERINHVADIVRSEVDAKNQVVVVLSAMAGETDRLVNLTKDLSKDFSASEYDVIISSGEQVSVGALSGLLNSLGVKSQSLLGWQVPIVTSSYHKSSRIEAISSKVILKLLEENNVVIIPGFQGINSEGRVTTLGRGGSDTSAVAIAAAIKADFCDIYTDVDGVYTTDPNKVPDAKRLDKISYEEMLEMASSGAGVLMARSVEFGRRYNVPIIVKSTFNNGEGTLVKEKVMEEAIVRGVTHNDKEMKFTLFGVPDQPGIAGKVFGPLSEGGIIVDMIVQNVSKDSKTDISFTAPTDQREDVVEILSSLSSDLDAEGTDSDENVARVSIIGAGMKAESGIASKMFSILGKNEINIGMISTSPIRISCVIPKNDMNKAIEALHEEFISQ